MEKVRGIASNVRNTVSISGGGENSQIITTHISVFQIDRRQIKAKSSEPLMINECDKVLVVGNTYRGIFNALAYKNLTTCVEGNEGWVLMLIFGVVLSGTGIVAISTFSNPFFGVFPKIIGSIFIAIGIYTLFRSARVLQAVNELRQEAP